MPGGGHPPVFQARGNPYAPPPLLINTLSKAIAIPARMGVGQRRTWRLMTDRWLGSSSSLCHVALVLSLELANNLELGESTGPDFPVVLEGNLWKDNCGSICR
jgi:hypothetical protein